MEGSHVDMGVLYDGHSGPSLEFRDNLELREGG